jgi:hypothetical protein
MTELTVSPSKPQMKASAFAGLFGLFAGLCAIFAAFATLVDWHDEAAQARWPLVPAMVERAELVAARASKDGGGTVWKLRTRVHYEINGEALTATLMSRPVFSEAEAATLRSWASQHRNGSPIDIRVDPSRENQAAFASAEISGAANRIRSDLVLLMIAAAASAGLLRLAKYLRAREASATPAADGAVGGGLVLGLGVAALGLMETVLVIHAGIYAHPFAVDNFMGVPACLMFVFAGILMALPPGYAKWRSLLASLLITCFALTLDWVAFGPGERRFTGSIMGFGFVSGQWMGRAVFGLFAVILDIWAIAMWIAECRRAFGVSASSDASIGRDGRTTGAFSVSIESKRGSGFLI